MDFITAFKQTKREHWSDAIAWLFFNLLGALVPIWGSLVILRLFSQNVTLDLFTAHGEFALYSASFLSAGFYVLSKDYGNDFIGQIVGRFLQQGRREQIRSTFPGLRWFAMTYIFLIFISALLFAGATFAHLPNITIPLDVGLLSDATLVIFVITMALSFVITALDNSVSRLRESEIAGLFGQQEQKLENDFDQMKRGK